MSKKHKNQEKELGKKFNYYNDDIDEEIEDEIQKEEYEEIEQKEFKKINDILKVEEKKDVYVSEFFLLPKLWVFTKLFKKNTLDLQNKLKEKLNFSFKPIIKILKLTKSIDNIKNTKKQKFVFLNDYTPEVDENFINLLDIENFYNETGPFSDIQKPKKTLNKVINSSIKITKEKIKKVNLIKFWFLVFLIFTFFISYLFLLKIEITKTFNKIQNFQITNDISQINKNLISLKSNLIISNILFKPIFLWNYIFSSKDIYNLNYLLNWIWNFADFLLNALIIYDGINNLILQKWVDEIMYSQLIDNIEPIIWKMNLEINKSISNFEKITNLWDDKLNDLFFSKLTQIKNLQKYFNIFYLNKDIFKSMLWNENKKIYAVIFQNNDEIRPTWWFIWSLWFIEIYKWKITHFEQKDVYALEWEMKNFSDKNWIAFDEKSPEWINKISETFWLRDANYFVDIKESSEKIKYFLDKTNYKIDGIIYINQNFILEVLEKIGWVYFEDIKTQITSTNFSMIISSLVESKVSKTHTLSTPKQILFDFSKDFFKEVKNNSDYLWYFKLFLESIEKKDIILYSFLDKENDFLKEMWLYKNDDFLNYLDFNYPIFTSISWNKSDRYITRIFEKNIFLNPDCSIKTSLNLKQKHEFNITEEIKIKNFLYDMDLLGKVDLENTLKIQWKWINKQFIRVLIPKNSQVEINNKIKVNDLEKYKEISFYLDTKPLFESNFEINYILQNPECVNYNYEFVKQSWIKNYNLILNKDWNLVDSLYTDKNYIFNN